MAHGGGGFLRNNVRDFDPGCLAFKDKCILLFLENSYLLFLIFNHLLLLCYLPLLLFYLVRLLLNVCQTHSLRTVPLRLHTEVSDWVDEWSCGQLDTFPPVQDVFVLLR